MCRKKWPKVVTKTAILITTKKEVRKNMKEVMILFLMISIHLRSCKFPMIIANRLMKLLEKSHIQDQKAFLKKI
jgi:hypothetical protein